MATIKPFAAIRPADAYAEKVISLPYDVMSREEAAKTAKTNPYSFLHIIRSEVDLPEQDDIYDLSVYYKAKSNLESFISDGIFIRDDKPMYYIYRQTMDGRSQTGLVACVSIEEYLNNTIKKHELTRVDKETDRIHHFDICNANTEPVFLTYRDKTELRTYLETCTINKQPVYDIKTCDGVEHKLWLINDDKEIDDLSMLFRTVPSLYIADGHHRSASAVNVGLQRRERTEKSDGTEEFNYFMAVLFPDCDLKIYDYNRVVKDLNGLTCKEFCLKLSEYFFIEDIVPGPFKPYRKHVFGMYLNDQWYKLTAKDHICSVNIVKDLDVSILQDYVLDPILGIKDPRTDKRIDFVGGIRGLKELEKLVKSDMKVAFALYPVTIEELLAVSDMGMIMPPKSTWFEPKLGSGLFIHQLPTT